MSSQAGEAYYWGPEATQGTFTRKLLAPAETALFYGFMIYTFIGLEPFQVGDSAGRADGSILNRITVLLLFILSLGIMSLRWQSALRCVRANSAVFAIVMFCMASWLWSDYPHLTLRRSMLFLFIVTITLGVAVSTKNIRQLHTRLFVSLIIVTIINLLGTAALPHIAITDIGVRGLYTQKNVAGIVAMITMIIGATWIIGARQTRHVLWGLAALVPVLVFLIITKSKTSINLTFLGLFCLMYFSLAEKIGPRFILVTVAAGVGLLAAGVGYLAIHDFNIDGALGAATGDKSFTGRDELWAFAKTEIQKRYWLGYGYGAFWDVGYVNDPLTRTEPGSWLAEVKTGVINQAHHGYLELWLNAGLPVTIVATLTIAYGFVSGTIKAILGKGDRQTRAAFAAFAILLGIHLVHNLTEATLFLRGASYCTTAFLALFVLSRSREFIAAQKFGG